MSRAKNNSVPTAQVEYHGAISSHALRQRSSIRDFGAAEAVRRQDEIRSGAVKGSSNRGVVTIH